MKKWTIYSLLMAAVMMGAIACSDGGTADDQKNVSDSIPPAGDPAAQKADSGTADVIPPVVETIRQSLITDILKADINVIPADDRKFAFETYDLNGDGSKEVIIGLRNSYFCGSGGCTAMLFTGEGKLINKFTVVDYPIWILPTTNKGWKDLAIFSGGKYRDVKFGSDKYPSNPSTLPAFKDAPPKEEARILDFDNKTLPMVSF